LLCLLAAGAAAEAAGRRPFDDSVCLLSLADHAGRGHEDFEASRLSRLVEEEGQKESEAAAAAEAMITDAVLSMTHDLRQLVNASLATGAVPNRANYDIWLARLICGVSAVGYRGIRGPPPALLIGTIVELIIAVATNICGDTGTTCGRLVVKLVEGLAPAVAAKDYYQGACAERKVVEKWDEIVTDPNYNPTPPQTGNDLLARSPDIREARQAYCRSVRTEFYEGWGDFIQFDLNTLGPINAFLLILDGCFLTMDKPKEILPSQILGVGEAVVYGGLGVFDAVKIINDVRKRWSDPGVSVDFIGRKRVDRQSINSAALAQHSFSAVTSILLTIERIKDKSNPHSKPTACTAASFYLASKFAKIMKLALYERLECRPLDRNLQNLPAPVGREAADEADDESESFIPPPAARTEPVEPVDREIRPIPRNGAPEDITEVQPLRPGEVSDELQPFGVVPGSS